MKLIDTEGKNGDVSNLLCTPKSSTLLWVKFHLSMLHSTNSEDLAFIMQKHYLIIFK